MDTVLEILFHTIEIIEAIKPVFENQRLLLHLINEFKINSIIKLLS